MNTPSTDSQSNTQPPHLITVASDAPAKTHDLAMQIAKHVKPGTIIGLVGDLGAGKTQFVRGLADGLGLNPAQVSSPTFVIVQEYENEDETSKLESLIHIDAYRIKKLDELTSIGWELTETVTKEGETLIGGEIRENRILVIEWADLIEDQLPKETLWIVIEHEFDGEQDRRQIHIHGAEYWSNLKSI